MNSPKFSPEQFKSLVDRYLIEINKLTTTKGVEYSGDADRLRNFRQGAEAIGITKETVLYIYMKKHWDAVTTYIKDCEAGNKRELSEPIQGRISDMLVYLLLLAAMVEENENASKS